MDPSPVRGLDLECVHAWACSGADRNYALYEAFFQAWCREDRSIHKRRAPTFANFRAFKPCLKEIQELGFDLQDAVVIQNCFVGGPEVTQIVRHRKIRVNDRVLVAVDRSVRAGTKFRRGVVKARFQDPDWGGHSDESNNDGLFYEYGILRGVMEAELFHRHGVRTVLLHMEWFHCAHKSVSGGVLVRNLEFRFGFVLVC